MFKKKEFNMKKNELGYITFKQLIYTLNIRDIRYGRFEKKEIEDTQIIKIYYDDNSSESFGIERDYLQIGWNDFYNKDKVWENLEKFLKKEVLNSYVTDIKYNDEEEILTIWTNKKPFETLEEHQN